MRLTKLLVACILILSLVSLFTVELSAVEKKADQKQEKININTAGVDSLSKLPGIGPKKAERIIDFRKKNGRFRRIQDIMKVKGIGEKTFKKFSGRIRV